MNTSSMNKVMNVHTIIFVYFSIKNKNIILIITAIKKELIITHFEFYI